MTTQEDWRHRTPELIEALREFGPLMRRRPFANEQGLRGVSAFALFWYLRRVAPDVVFEVGVWRGFSTWLIEQAVPQAEIVCHDPIFLVEHMLRRRWRKHRYRSPRATYSTEDFSCAPVAETAAAHAAPLVFFDDHQHKLPRLLQAHAAGIRHVIFDDNTTELVTHRTLEQDRREPQTAETLERLVETYEVFPALWAVHVDVAGQRIDEDGLGVPVEETFANIHAERDWHSYVTYLRLR